MKIISHRTKHTDQIHIPLLSPTIVLQSYQTFDNNFIHQGLGMNAELLLTMGYTFSITLDKMCHLHMLGSWLDIVHIRKQFVASWNLQIHHTYDSTSPL